MKMNPSKTQFLKMQKALVTDRKMADMFGVCMLTVIRYRRKMGIKSIFHRAIDFKVRRINVLKYDSAAEAIRAFLRRNNMSLMKFSKYCGISRRNLICDFLHERQKLSNLNMFNVMDGMWLKGFERIYFEAMANVHNARNILLKEKYQENLDYLRRKAYQLK